MTVDGRLVHEAGYGLADVENARPCRPDTVMRIASISKAVTATIAARLVDEGKLDLDASVYVSAGIGFRTLLMLNRTCCPPSRASSSRASRWTSVFGSCSATAAASGTTTT